MSDPRPAPEQDAVRERMRHERDTVPDEQDEASGDGAPEWSAESTDPDTPAEHADPEADGDSAAAEADGDSAAAPSEAAAAEDSDVARKRDEYLALAQRTQADFDNYRKRAARDVAAAGSRAKVGLARELLPAIDNLERARDAAGEAEQGLAQGVDLVHDELIAALARGGIERFDPSGEPFDPTHHEAIATRPEEGVEPGLVLDVAQKGYRSQDTVVRPARVVVSA